MASKKKVDIDINVNADDAVDGLNDVNEAVNDTTSSVDDLQESTGAFGGALGSLKGGFTSLKKGLKASMLGFKGLKGAIAATGIGLLLLAFTSLISYFTKTKKGAELLEQATAALGAAFSIIVDRLSLLGEKLVSVFTDPQQSIKDLGNTIQSFVSDKVDAVIETFGLLGDAIKKVFQGDFKGALEDAGEAGKIFITELNPIGAAITGIAGSIEGLVESTKTLGTEISNAASAAVELEKRQQALNDRNREFMVTQAGIMDNIDTLKQLSDDQTKSEEERIGFLQEAAAIESSIANERLRNAQEQVSIIAAQNAISESTAEDLDRLAEAEVVLAEARAASSKVATELIIKESAIRKQVEDERIAIIQETEDLIIEMLEEGLEKKITLIETEKQRKLDAIKGTGEAEIDLRLAIEEKAQQEVNDLKDEANAAELSRESDFLMQLEDLRIRNLKDGAEKERAINAAKFEVERQAVLEDILLTKEQKDLLLAEIKVAEDEASLLIDTDEAARKEENKVLLSSENKEKADSAIASAQATVELAQAVNGALNAVSDLRIQKKQNETDDLINAERKRLKSGAIDQQAFDKFEQKAKLKQAKFVDREAEKAFKRNKVLAIATTAINTAAAIVNALATLPYPASLVAAIAAGVTGAASIATIASKRYKSSSTSSPSAPALPDLKLSGSGNTGGSSFGNSGSVPSLSGSSSITPGPSGVQTTLTSTDGSETETLGDGSQGEQQPIQAYVSERDITNVQNNISNIEQQSEIGG